MNIFTKFISLKIKRKIYNLIEKYKLDRKYKSLLGYNKFYILGAPNHGNLGDCAIISAEVKFLNDKFSNYKVIEIDIGEYYKHLPWIKKYISDSEIIFLHGGGNFGNQYMVDESIRRNVIDSFPKNKIIMFPQTVFFTDNEEGNCELERSKKIYSNHKKLTLISREEPSYNFMKQHFKNNNIILIPDMVLYMNEHSNLGKREGALLCLRTDVESILFEKEKKYVFNLLKEKYSSVSITDTVIKRNVCIKERNRILEEKFKEFKSAELVITDRIHGMIFAAITGTPCIAISNYNYKVKGTYNWLRELEYIKYTDNLEDISKYILLLNKYDRKNEFDFKYKYMYDDLVKEIVK